MKNTHKVKVTKVAHVKDLSSQYFTKIRERVGSLEGLLKGLLLGFMEGFSIFLQSFNEYYLLMHKLFVNLLMTNFTSAGRSICYGLRNLFF